jgi:membrane-associated protease RseP (regulator of RpoE activity)
VTTLLGLRNRSAQRLKLSLALLGVLPVLITGCATTSGQKPLAETAHLPQTVTDSPGIQSPQIPLVPLGRLDSEDIAPVIRHLLSNSAAEKYGLRVNDHILKINGRSVLTNRDVEKMIKRAPVDSTVTVRRMSKIQNIKINLPEQSPRLGATMQPAGIALVKKSSPFISYMYGRDMIVFAQASINDTKSNLRINFIIQSQKTQRTPLRMTIEDKANESLAQITSQLSTAAHLPTVFTKNIAMNSKPHGPLAIRLDIATDKFVFEFQ